jgi:WD40 repeat protein/serine/threonine protein kinase
MHLMSKCPPEQQLKLFLAEELSPSECEALEEHLAECPHCPQRLHKLTSEPVPSHWRELFAHQQQNDVRSDPAWLDQLARLEPDQITDESVPRVTREWVTARDAETPSGAGDADNEELSPQPVPMPWPVVPGYEVLGELGRGGMGVVYKARQTGVNRLVALKMIRAGQGAGAEELARFRREAEAAGRLQHPNLVQVYEVGAHAGLPYLCLEYVDGGNLAERLAGLPQPARPAAALVELLARAMHYAHERGIVHRDLKPANILLQSILTAEDAEERRGNAAASLPLRSSASSAVKDFTPKISDFGLAKLVHEEGRLTRTGLVLGTPSYMAPEQVLPGSETIGPAADVYALGAILYELLSGRAPFVGETPLDTAEQVVHAEPVPLRRLNAKIPRDLETITLKCLAKEPAGRYPTGQALADDLQRWRDGKPIHARPVGQMERALRWCKRNPAVAGLMAAVVLVTAAGFLATLWQLRTALEQKGIAQTAQQNLRRLLYASDINVARQALEEGHLTRARELLERQRPQPGEEDLRGFEWRYLWRLSRDGSLHTFGGHTGGVNAVRFSPDGKMLASASPDGTVRLWDVAARRAIVQLRQQEGGIFSLAFTPDGQLLATGSYDGHVEIWDVAARRRVTTLPKAGSGVAFTPDGKILAAGRGGGGVTLWDVTTRHQLGTLKGLSEVIAFSPDGRILAAYSADTNVQLWDVARREQIATLRGHSADVLNLAFSPDGKVLASASQDATIKLWDVATRQEVHSLHAHTAPVTSLAFSPDGKTMVTGSTDSTVKFWHTTTWQEVRTLRGHTAQVEAVAFSPDGKMLVTGSDDNTMKLWDVANDAAPNVFPGDKAWVHSLAFSPDSKTLASGCEFDKTIKLWDFASGRQVATLRDQRGPRGLQFSPNGQTLASTSRDDKIVRLWDVATRRELARFPHTAEVDAVRISPDGTMLAANDGTSVRLWNLATGRERARLSGSLTRLSGQSTAFTFAPDSKTLATGSDDGTIRLWDITTQQTIMTLNEPAAAQVAVPRAANSPPGIRDLAFSPDGQRLVSAGEDLTVRLWEPTTGQEILPHLKGHTGMIWSLAFAPDGKTVATCSRDGTVKLWNLKVQAEAATLKHHHGQIAAVAFAPDGNVMATAGADGTIRLWRAAPFTETDALPNAASTAPESP